MNEEKKIHKIMRNFSRYFAFRVFFVRTRNLLYVYHPSHVYPETKVLAWDKSWPFCSARVYYRCKWNFSNFSFRAYIFTRSSLLHCSRSSHGIVKLFFVRAQLCDVIFLSREELFNESLAEYTLSNSQTNNKQLWYTLCWFTWNRIIHKPSFFSHEKKKKKQ